MAATHHFIFHEKKRRWAPMAALALGVGIVAGALAFFISLFIAIVVLFIIGMFRQHAPGQPPIDMAISYRYIAAPIAAATLPIATLASLWRQTRRLPRTPMS